MRVEPNKAGMPLTTDLPLRRPVLIPILLMVIALLFRVADIFILRLDEAWGEIILSKSLGFLLVLAYLLLLGAGVRQIGLHTGRLREALAWTAVACTVIYTAVFVAQVAAIDPVKQPALAYGAIDPKTGMAGGALFALWLVLGNFVNSFMEEGLFRGIMIRHFRVRLSSGMANLLQAALFALWHLVWPVKHYLYGQSSAVGALGEAGVLLLATFIGGLTYGYLYLRTDSLWAPWLAHTVNNTVLNLLHIRTVDGLDVEVMVLHTTLALGLVLLIPWTRWWTARVGMPEVRPWGAVGQ